jgi:hypothetical protein
VTKSSGRCSRGYRLLVIVIVGWIAARIHLIGDLAQPQQVPSQTQQQTPPQPQ